MNQSHPKSFKKIQEQLLKIYPGAKTKMKNKKFYLVNSETGDRILTEEYKIPESETIFDAWKRTLEVILTRKIIEKNNSRFSDDKIISKMEKRKKSHFDIFFVF